MLDDKLVFQELDDLLDEHYTWVTTHKPARIHVYNKPDESLLAKQAQLPTTQSSASTTAKSEALSAQARFAPAKTTPLGELVANIFVLVLLSVLSNKTTR